MAEPGGFHKRPLDVRACPHAATVSTLHAVKSLGSGQTATVLIGWEINNWLPTSRHLPHCSFPRTASTALWFKEGLVSWDQSMTPWLKE